MAQCLLTCRVEDYNSFSGTRCARHSVCVWSVVHFLPEASLVVFSSL